MSDDFQPMPPTAPPHPLVGRDVSIQFLGDPSDWPVPPRYGGSPLWGRIESVNWPLLEVRQQHYRDSMWINAACIKYIRVRERT